LVRSPHWLVTMLRVALAFCLALLLMRTVTHGAEFEIGVSAELARYGKARVIIVIDPSEIVPAAATTDEAVDHFGQMLGEEARHALRRIGRQPIFAGTLSDGDLQPVKGAPGINVYLSRPVPPLLDEARTALGLPIAEPQQLPPTAVKDPASYAVAILDTGFDLSHPFFKTSILRESCFSVSEHHHIKVTSLCPNGFEKQTSFGASGKCPSAAAACRHGTHVAGIIAGTGGAREGHLLTGIAPGIPLILINVYTQLDDAGDCQNYANATAPCIASFLDSQLDALEYIAFILSAEHRVAAVNMSMGVDLGAEVDCRKNVLAFSISSLRDRGILTVAAAGNNKLDRVFAPACGDDTVAVSATDKSGAFAREFPAPSNGGSNLSGKTEFAAHMVIGAWRWLPPRYRHVDGRANGERCNRESPTDHRPNYWDTLREPQHG
jgi:hypothetical protein